MLSKKKGKDYVIILLIILLSLLIVMRIDGKPPWPNDGNWSAGNLSVPYYRLPYNGNLDIVKDHYESRYGKMPDVMFWEPDTIKNEIQISATWGKTGMFSGWFEMTWPPENLTWKTIQPYFFWWMQNVETGDTICTPIACIPDSLPVVKKYHGTNALSFDYSVDYSDFPLPRDTCVYECRILISSEAGKTLPVEAISRKPLFCLSSPAIDKFDSLMVFWYHDLYRTDIEYSYKIIQAFPEYDYPIRIRYRQLVGQDSTYMMSQMARHLLLLYQNHNNYEWNTDKDIYTNLYDNTIGFAKVRKMYEAEVDSTQ